jgi:hypothetical protein
MLRLRGSPDAGRALWQRHLGLRVIPFWLSSSSCSTQCQWYEPSTFQHHTRSASPQRLAPWDPSRRLSPPSCSGSQNAVGRSFPDPANFEEHPRSSSSSSGARRKESFQPRPNVTKSWMWKCKTWCGPPASRRNVHPVCFGWLHRHRHANSASKPERASKISSVHSPVHPREANAA